MSRPRLATREAPGQRRRADREQRQAADLVQRAGAVEQLEQARHDVDGDAVVAADADAAQQLLVAGAREGDDHAVDFALVEHLVELVERAELRQPLRRRRARWTSSSTRPIVSRPNSPWRSSRSARRSATRPEPTITVRWRSGATRWAQPRASARAGAVEAGGERRWRRARRAAAWARSSAAATPKIGQESSSAGDDRAAARRRGRWPRSRGRRRCRGRRRRRG